MNTPLEEAIDSRVGEVRFDAVDFSFGELSSLHAQKEIVIDPEYQRLFRWSNDQRSRLIESVLLGLPLPQIFLIENQDGILELIDGLQRVSSARTLDPGRSQVNIMRTRKREHSRKPDEQYKIIEECSWGPRLEMFSRGKRRGWTVWGNQADDGYKPTWDTYSYNSAMEIAAE